MRTIWKYRIPLQDEIEYIDIPIKAKILTVATQNDEIYIWVEIETENPLERVPFILVGTGYSLDTSETIRYIGTTSINRKGINFVFHVYQIV